MKNMKYKVLAADDEFWSRENIRNLIPWEEYSLEFLEPACDGEEVMERIAEEKPDIILTDINMPFLSGLELLQRLQNEYPEIITIAISGYDDFDKVKGVFVFRRSGLSSEACGKGRDGKGAYQGTGTSGRA
jgi:Response regulator containing CheY-like receiver domain and AraC-type DNA-binding domain